MDLPPFLRLLLRYLWISGRSSRLEWWLVHLSGIVAFAINDTVWVQSSNPVTAGITFHVVPPIWLYINLLLLWISFTSIVRRLHDRNRSGWWSLLYPWPIIGWAWFFIECGMLPGRKPAEVPPAPVGLVQRALPQPWTPLRIAKAAGNAIGLMLVALFLYKWFFEPRTPPVFESELQRPAKSELVE